MSNREADLRETRFKNPFLSLGLVRVGLNWKVEEENCQGEKLPLSHRGMILSLGHSWGQLSTALYIVSLIHHPLQYLKLVPGSASTPRNERMAVCSHLIKGGSGKSRNRFVEISSLWAVSWWRIVVRQLTTMRHGPTAISTQERSGQHITISAWALEVLAGSNATR